MPAPRIDAESIGDVMGLLQAGRLLRGLGKKEMVVPYSPELDAALPVGTILPSVVIVAPFEGDRADVRAEAKWSRGCQGGEIPDRTSYRPYIWRLNP